MKKFTCFMVMFFVLITPSFTQAATLTVKLEWRSGSKRTDLDLYIKNPKGEICNYESGKKNTNWGATHVRDDMGSANSYSYESFTVDLDAMDCYSSGDYEFHINHYSGPDVTSTISTSGGQSWNFTTSKGADKYAVRYSADKNRCNNDIIIQATTLAKSTATGEELSDYIDYLYDMGKIITYDAPLSSGGEAFGYLTKFYEGWDGSDEYLYCEWSDARIEINQRHSVEYMASAIIHEISHYRDFVVASNNWDILSMLVNQSF